MKKSGRWIGRSVDAEMLSEAVDNLKGKLNKEEFDFWSSVANIWVKLKNGKLSFENINRALKSIEEGRVRYAKRSSVEWHSIDESDQEEAEERVEDVRDHFASWHNFLTSQFGLRIDFSKIDVPTRHSLFDQPLIIAQELTPSCIIAAMCKHMKVHVASDLQDLDRTMESTEFPPYMLWVKRIVEGDIKMDERWDFISGDRVSISLREYLLFHFYYWWKNNIHLDSHHATLCARSYGADGEQPYVYWHAARPDDDVEGALHIEWHSQRNADNFLRLRQVIV